MRQILLAAVLSLAVGCVGGISGPPGDDDIGDDGDDDIPTPSLAKGMYERDVYPILTAKCGAGCHLVGASTSTAFVTPSLTDAHFTITSYSSVVGNFTEVGAPVLTYITTQNHNARTYTTGEQDLIKAWLAQEVIERAAPQDPNDPPPTETPGQATERIMQEWSGCLLETDFVELQFGQVWANKGSNEGNCEQCHQNGAGGFFANDDNVLTYQVLSQNRYFMTMFFRADVLNLADAKMVPNIEAIMRVGNNEAPFTEHPAFDPLDNTAGLNVSPAERLQELYDRTMLRKAAGTCGPPTLIN